VNPLLRNSAAHLVLNNIDSISLSDNDAHHLFRVLRLRDGQSVTATDGAGRWRECRVVGRDGIEIVGSVVVENSPSITIGVAFVPVKAEKPETTVRQLVEVGVDIIDVLLPTKRAVAGTRDRLNDRIHTIVREACMQSRRVFGPQVNVGANLAEVLAQAGVAIADPEGGPLSAEHQYIVVGPEGGFDASEVPETVAQVSIGPVVMRAETAALVAGARLVALHERQ
jgi:16S rRNA (uracil1498-N3)-methyltransferase